jgi:hypothetical protein
LSVYGILVGEKVRTLITACLLLASPGLATAEPTSEQLDRIISLRLLSDNAKLLAAASFDFHSLLACLELFPGDRLLEATLTDLRSEIENLKSVVSNKEVQVMGSFIDEAAKETRIRLRLNPVKECILLSKAVNKDLIAGTYKVKR